MTCDEFLPALELEPERGAEARAHAERCSTCAAALADWRRLRAELGRAAPLRESDRAAWRSVMGPAATGSPAPDSGADSMSRPARPGSDRRTPRRGMLAATALLALAPVLLISWIAPSTFPPRLPAGRSPEKPLREQVLAQRTTDHDPKPPVVWETVEVADDLSRGLDGFADDLARLEARLPDLERRIARLEPRQQLGLLLASLGSSAPVP